MLREQHFLALNPAAEFNQNYASKPGWFRGAARSHVALQQAQLRLQQGQGSVLANIGDDVAMLWHETLAATQTYGGLFMQLGSLSSPLRASNVAFTLGSYLPAGPAAFAQALRLQSGNLEPLVGRGTHIGDVPALAPFSALRTYGLLGFVIEALPASLARRAEGQGRVLLAQACWAAAISGRLLLQLPRYLVGMRGAVSAASFGLTCAVVRASILAHAKAGQATLQALDGTLGLDTQPLQAHLSALQNWTYFQLP